MTDASLLIPSRSDIDRRAPHRATGEVVTQFGQAEAQELYGAFLDFNARFFDGRLAPPLVLILPIAPNTLGDYCPRDIHGLDSRIRIAPKAVRRGARFREDVLLHEMIHAWQNEVHGDLEPGYRGHGTHFAAQCNRIGALLGLPVVGVKGRNGLPDCKHWPHNVRPPGYYPLEWTRPKRARPEGTGLMDASEALEMVLVMLESFDRPMLEQVETAVASELGRRKGN